MQVPAKSFEEIERLMEEEIVKSLLWPKSKYEKFDIEAFLGDHLRVDFDAYRQLPPEIMGEVIFSYEEQTRVNINRDLTFMADDMADRSSRWMKGRWRMTVAHEGAHVILHGPLFCPKDAEGLPLKADRTQTYRCHKKNISEMGASPTKRENAEEYEKDRGWKRMTMPPEDKHIQRLEMQANYGAAALLMPRSQFITASQELSSFINEGYARFPSEKREYRIIQELAERFDVSVQAARIRCKQLQLTKLAP